MIRDGTFTLLLLSQGVLLPSLSWSILGSQGQPSAFTALACLRMVFLHCLQTLLCHMTWVIPLALDS